MWTMASLDQRAKVVCGTCNKGWMSDLESEVRPLICNAISVAAPMALSATQQQTLAAWAVKTAFCLMAGDPRLRDKSYLPPDNLRWLLEHKTSPPPATHAWLFLTFPFSAKGRYRGLWARAGSMGLWQTYEAEGYLATFAIGHLGFHVFGRDQPVAGISRTVLGRYWHDATVPIWPPTLTGANWPPRKMLSRPEMNLLATWGYRSD